MKRGVRYRTDPKVPAAPLRAFIPRSSPAGHPGESCYGPRQTLYGRKHVAREFGARLGVTDRQAERWMSQILRSDEVPLWLADEFCTFNGIPFAFIYPELDTTNWEGAVA